jgi:hypothetical protein
MRLEHSRASIRRAVWTVAACCALVSGCGDDGPTGPSPPATLTELLGDRLYRADGTGVATATLEGVAVIGIYFASQGCPACGRFTPNLVGVYHTLQEQGRSFEVVLVTPATTDSAVLGYMTSAEMPWLAVPAGNAVITGLVERYAVRWVPTLVVIDGAGRTLSRRGREDLDRDGIAAYDDWLAASPGT